jgi:hypothetical protein
VEHFKVGEVVARRNFLIDFRGTVVRVTDDGYFVTVQWSDWLGLPGRESTNLAEDLVRVTEEGKR